MSHELLLYNVFPTAGKINLIRSALINISNFKYGLLEIFNMIVINIDIYLNTNISDQDKREAYKFIMSGLYDINSNLEELGANFRLVWYACDFEFDGF